MQKKTALITGASAGLGRDYARLFADNGHDVVLVARRRERLEELAAELAHDHGVAAHVVPADLTDTEAVRNIASEIEVRGLQIDYLVNNAGFGSNGAFADLDADRELDMIAVNVRAPVQMTRILLPQMIARGSGRILNIGSTAGFQPGPFMATYYASKAFVIHFSEALYLELAGSGVTVTVSCPGPVETEFGAVSGNGKSRLFKGGGASSETIAADGYRAMMKGKRMVVHGLRSKLLVQSLRLSPRRAVLGIAARLNKPA